MLTAFPEGKVSVQIFNMQPLNGSGWGPRTDVKTMAGVLQCTGGRRVRKSNGNLVLERKMRFWSNVPLTVGWFLDDGQYVYRIGLPDDDWSDYADFVIYDLERLVGADGTEVVEPAFNQGGGHFA
jgi:hypothetical protein